MIHEKMREIQWIFIMEEKYSFHFTTLWIESGVISRLQKFIQLSWNFNDEKLKLIILQGFLNWCKNLHFFPPRLNNKQQNFMHWNFLAFQHLRDDLRKIKIQFSPEKKNIKVCRLLQKSNKCTNLNPLCERRKSFLSWCQLKW